MSYGILVVCQLDVGWNIIIEDMRRSIVFTLSISRIFTNANM